MEDKETFERYKANMEILDIYLKKLGIKNKLSTFVCYPIKNNSL